MGERCGDGQHPGPDRTWFRALVLTQGLTEYWCWRKPCESSVQAHPAPPPSTFIPPQFYNKIGRQSFHGRLPPRRDLVAVSSPRTHTFDVQLVFVPSILLPSLLQEASGWGFLHPHPRSVRKSCWCPGPLALLPPKSAQPYCAVKAAVLHSCVTRKGQSWALLVLLRRLIVLLRRQRKHPSGWRASEVEPRGFVPVQGRIGMRRPRSLTLHSNTLLPVWLIFPPLSLLLFLNLASTKLCVFSLFDCKVRCLFWECLINRLEGYFELSEISALLPLHLLPQNLDLDSQASSKNTKPWQRPGRKSWWHQGPGGRSWDALHS